MGSGGKSIFDNLRNYIEWTIRAVLSIDPNDITGPKGYDSKKWVSVKDKMSYTIRFENDPEFATAPAQNVLIHLPIDSGFNINSFRLGSFGFGQYTFQVPDSSAFYTTTLDLRDSLGIFVDVLAGIDILKNEVFWRLRSIDPVTGKTPFDALKGFLPVNDTSAKQTEDSSSHIGKGEGFVSFQISPDLSLHTGDTVSTTAGIVFDINPEIPTNTWDNTLDALAPVSSIVNHSVTNYIITLYWSGQDDANGSGIRDYALYVSENNGTFTLYKNHILETAISFSGTPGSTYQFFTLATDNTDNQEILKKGGDLSIELNGIDVAMPITWLYFNGIPQAKDVLLNWATTTEKNSKEFIIERSLNGRDFKDIGSVQANGNTNQTSNYRYLDKEAMSLETKMLYYRLRQIDMDGKYTYSNIIAIPVKQNLHEAIVKAYPNPFTQNISLQIITISQSDKTDNVLLYSSDGKLVYQRKVSIIGSSTILLENLPSLKPGIYMLKTVIAKKLYTIKMIKQ